MAFMNPSTSNMNNQSHITPSQWETNRNENFPMISEDILVDFQLSKYNNYQQDNAGIENDNKPPDVFQLKRKRNTNENLPTNSGKVKKLSKNNHYHKNKEAEDHSIWIDFLSIHTNFLISIFIHDSNGSLKGLLIRLINLALELEFSPTKFLELLQKIDLHDSLHILPTTEEALWDVLGCKDFQIVEYFYCKECPLGYLITEHRRMSSLPRPQCPNCSKVRPEYPESTLSSFVSIDLYSQIRHLFSIPGLYQALQYRFYRKHRFGVYKDVYDAPGYHSLSYKNRFLSFPHHFTLTININAYKVGNSPTMKAWPIYVQINEFSQHLRERYMLLAGIYVDDQPPKMDKFISPLKTQLQKLCEEGILWKTVEGKEIRSKFLTIMWSVDSFTHSNMLHMNQCDEHQKWINCYIQNESSMSSEYSMPVTQLKQRFETHEEIQKLPLNMYYQLIVEPMDILFLGVVKQHMKIMLETPNTPYYIGSKFHRAFIDETLLTITLPQCCHVNPRSISRWKDWTAHEWRHWLGYAPICLDGVTEVKYINHLSLLSDAVEMIINNCTKSHELLMQQSHIDKLLKKYIFLLYEYFGIQTMSYEIYLLTQMTYLVEKWASLSSFSGFKCELWNQKILHKKIMKETLTCKRNISNYIINDIISLYLQHKYISYNDLDSLLTKASKQSMPNGKKDQAAPYTHIYQDNTKYVETTSPMEPKLTPTEESCLKKENFPSALSFYSKIKKNGIEFQTFDGSNSVFCNSIIASDKGEYGIIRHIMSCQCNNQTVYKVCIQKFAHVQYAFNTQYISQVKMTDKLVNLDIEKIFPAIKVVQGNQIYVYRYLPF